MLEVLKTVVANWLFYRETVDRLSWLSDHELADMGMSRNDIYRHARQAVYGQR